MRHFALLGVMWVLSLALGAELVADTAGTNPVRRDPVRRDPVEVVLRERLAPADQAAASADAAPAGVPRGPMRVGDIPLAQAVAELYAGRDFRPVWGERRRFEQLATVLAGIGGDGLDPEDYHLSQLLARRAALNAGADDPAASADLDLLATDAYLRVLFHLFRGKVDPGRLEPRRDFALRDIAPEQDLRALSEVLDGNRLAAIFERARPDNPLYRKMRDGLTQLRMAAAQGGWPVWPVGPTLKPGMSDTRLPALRRRLLPAEAPADGTEQVYDETLAAAVAQFQRDNYLEADGVLGPSTQAALAASVAERIDQMRVNLERGRWLLHDLGNEFVLVDIAGFKIWFFRDGQPVWNARVQVGKPYRRTPVFKSAINVITFNPTWTVPPTILNEDILPLLQYDLGYLRRNRIRVLDADGRRLDPESIDWDRPGRVTLRQESGASNSLGRVAIRFPNPYSVYLHDTPHQNLFERGQRAVSSGCIRVERPLELVELLMNDPRQWDRATIDTHIAGGKTHNVTLERPVPIVLMYWTVDVLGGQGVAFKPDIYQRDAAVLRALNARPGMAAVTAARGEPGTGE